MSEKRKNDFDRRFRGWQLVAAFMLGALAMLLVFQVWGAPVAVVNNNQPAPAELALTATHVVEQATMQANLDPFMLTATHLVAQATAQANGSIDQAGVTAVPADLDPFILTATHFVAQATAAAAGN